MRVDYPLVVEIEYFPAEHAFLALSDLPGPFFIDSAGGLLADDARFSIVGADPCAIVETVEDKTVVRGEGAGPQGESVAPLRRTSDPFAVLETILARNALASRDGLPFAGGLVGYLGYDLRHFIERLPQRAGREMLAPDMFFGLYDAAAVFDHALRRAYVVSSGVPLAGPLRERRARGRAECIAARLADCGRMAKSVKGAACRTSPSHSARSNFDERDYLRAVSRAREYIFAGDVYQVNLSQRFEAPLPAADAPRLYSRLRRISKAPFGAYLDTGTTQILSNSPERFLLKDGDRVETRPIKGTRPRGATPEEDAALAAELEDSEKDAAEHVMIVDLERNDLGRVCETGTVRVERLAGLYGYANVHHLVSTVAGRTRAGAGCLLRALFPGGSITGAPKVRAMEIIDELEPVRRGIYTGSIGYLSLCGRIDLNIAIRTLVLEQGIAYFQVGGGIVADSEPELEYEETLHKASAFFALVDEMEEGGSAG
ncbi:MAG: aminodeoxychorismate synthase component I [Actinobacteria bacterium]|nr:MAG: aminodeoxychorismate synthase component I [Actinomycetota bacterium]